MNVVRVGMADLNVVKDPGMITTLGLGSCIGITLYDKILKVGGLAHIMLPNSRQSTAKDRNQINKAKFADTAIVELFNNMLRFGCKKNNISAKIAGGAQMFAFAQATDLMKIGERNAIASKEILSILGVPLLAEDVGKNYGRTIELYTQDGRLLIKTIGKGSKWI